MVIYFKTCKGSTHQNGMILTSTNKHILIKRDGQNGIKNKRNIKKTNKKEQIIY